MTSSLNLGAIFCPVGFHHAGLRQFELDQETGLLPEILDLAP